MVRQPAPVAPALAGFSAGIGATALGLAAVVQANEFVRYGLDLAVASGIKSFPPPYFWPVTLALVGLLGLAGAGLLFRSRRPRRIPVVAVALEDAAAPDGDADLILLKAPDLAFLDKPGSRASGHAANCPKLDGVAGAPLTLRG
jgi:hypothetical protein